MNEWVAFFAALVLAATHGTPSRGSLPPSTLAARLGGTWRIWWRSDSAPTRWQSSHPTVTRAIVWRSLPHGARWGELRLAGTAEAWRLRVVLLHLDPKRVRFHFALPVSDDGSGRWRISDADPRAIAAFDAGQFASDRPWGWLVKGGVEVQPPGDGALAAGVVIDSSGSLRIIARDEIVAFRRRAGVESALQSYPAILLGDGDVPRQLADTGQGVSLVHRDARLSLGILRDSTVLIALTRFEGLNGVLDVLPFGPTVPEMAALMGALGCTRAVLLDGGISGQLMVRDAKAAHEWPGLRGVPMGIEVVARR